jgi:hypothetical protein
MSRSIEHCLLTLLSRQLDSSGVKPTRASKVLPAVAVDLPWVKKRPAEVQVDLYGNHTHTSPSSPGVTLLHDLPVKKLSPRKLQPLPLPPALLPSPPTEEPTAPRRRVTRAATPVQAKPAKTGLRCVARAASPASDERTPSLAVAATSMLQAVRAAYERPSSPNHAPQQDDPLADHLRYHAEVHWGLNKETATACFLAAASFLLLWLLALLAKASSAALGVAIHVPVPTVNLKGLWAAASHPRFGLPALPRALAAHARTCSVGTAALAISATALVAAAALQGPPRLLLPAYRAWLGWRSGLRTQTKSVGGRPTGYLEGVPRGCKAVRAAHGGVPTVLVIHDAFGSKHDVHPLVTQGFKALHVVVPDWPGHGDHLVAKV